MPKELSDTTIHEPYTSTKYGQENGSELSKFKAIMQDMQHTKMEPFKGISVDGEYPNQEHLSKLKEISNILHPENCKTKKLEYVEEKAGHKTEKMGKGKREGEGDVCVSGNGLVKIFNLEKIKGSRVKVFGWVHRIGRQGQALKSLVLRDGTGFLRCVLNEKVCSSNEAVGLTTESSVLLSGALKKISEGEKVRVGLELHVDNLELIGTAPSGGVDSILNETTSEDVQFDNRHLMIRNELVSRLLKVRSIVLQAFRDHYLSQNYTEVTPPILETSKIDGDGLIFKLNFYGEEASLTQSGQLYLETCLPAVGDVFSIAQSFRAEKKVSPSKSRRHLAEFTHVEAECAYITYDELLDKIEYLICDVVERVLDSPYGYLVKLLNPDFKPPQRPFMRMDYSVAIEFLKSNNIRKPDGSFYEFGEDIPEMAERALINKINQPVLLCRFPAEIKYFCMSRCPEDNQLTESVDLLLPGVGETVGSSMRMWNYDELLDAYKKHGMDSALHYWFTDSRKYGTCPHGGYGLGLERFLCWLLNRRHVQEFCLYPRYWGRSKP